MLFRALSAGTSLLALQYTGKLLDMHNLEYHFDSDFGGNNPTDPVEWASLLAPLRRAPVPSLISSLVLVNNCIAWGPFMYCYLRKTWWALALFTAAVVALVAWDPVLDWGLSQLLHEHVDPARLWHMFVRGTGRVAGQLPQWCLYAMLAQVQLMVWFIALGGGIGIGVTAALVSLVHRTVRI